MPRWRVRFEGRVQGVGFRATARSIARARAVSGWVRNEPDGSVLMEVQGDEAEVTGVIDELRRVMGRFVRGEARDVMDEQEGEQGFAVQR